MENAKCKFEDELTCIVSQAKQADISSRQIEVHMAIERLLAQGCSLDVIAKFFEVKSLGNFGATVAVQQNLILAQIARILADLFPISNVVGEQESSQPLKVDEDGVLRINGRSYLTVGQFVKLFGIWGKLIVRKIKAHEIPSVRAIAINGKECNFYDEGLMRTLFEYRFSLSMADGEGLISGDPEPYHCLMYFAEKFGLDFYTVKKAVQDVGINPVSGRDRNGKFCDFYNDRKVDKVLRPYKSLKRANADGVILFKEGRYTTVENFPGYLSNITGRRAVKSYKNAITRAGLSPKKGLSRQGKICDFYGIESVQALFNCPISGRMPCDVYR